MKVRFKKSAVKAINAMDSPTKKRIKTAIEGLKETPPLGDIKPLQGSKDGTMRLRVGKYRVLFRYDKDNEIEILLILDIGPRGNIYKRGEL